MHTSNPETIYSAGSGDWTQARLITIWGSAHSVPNANEPQRQAKLHNYQMFDITMVM